MAEPTALLTSSLLRSIAGTAHAFETRQSSLASVLPAPVLRLRQVHGTRVHVIEAATDLTPYLHPNLEDRPAGDAVVTTRPEITVAVATADCVPVLLASSRADVVGAAHAGWRGLAAGVLEATVASMRAAGAPVTSLRAAIGPCAGRSAYEVSVEVRTAFLDAGLPADLFEPTRPGHWLCDLAAAAAASLRHAGVAQVERLDRCTVSDPEAFHSWRRDGAVAGRMLSGIAIQQPGRVGD